MRAASEGLACNNRLRCVIHTVVLVFRDQSGPSNFVAGLQRQGPDLWLTLCGAFTVGVASSVTSADLQSPLKGSSVVEVHGSVPYSGTRGQNLMVDLRSPEGVILFFCGGLSRS